MALEVIYVTRHGFRSNWLVNPSTGDYTAVIRSPTGIPADPALTAHGVEQARELGKHLLSVDPPVQQVYSSPYYRCLQTVEPFVRSLNSETNSIAEGTQAPVSAKTDPAHYVGSHPQVHQDLQREEFRVRVEPGLGEWYGSAPFEHPSPAAPARLRMLFPTMLEEDYTDHPAVVPPRRGESLDELHNRVALAVGRIIDRCDREGIRAVLICSHAAVVIALGRVLTGQMPRDVKVEDFRAFTCGLSVYRRRHQRDQRDRRKGARTTSTVTAEKALIIGEASRKPAPTTQQAETSVTDDAHIRGATSEFEGETWEPQPSVQTLLTLNHNHGHHEGRVALDDNRKDRRDQQDLELEAGDGCDSQPVEWRNNRGVRGGWDCETNSDCSFLSGGEERGWRFAGDESFASRDNNSIAKDDAGVQLGVVVEGHNVERSKAHSSHSPCPSNHGAKRNHRL